MPASLTPLNRSLALKPEPELTPALKQIVARERARTTVSDYLFTPALRSHAKRIFECAVHGKGQGFWVQAEYGAGKTSFLGTILCLLMRGEEEKVWEVLRDQELRDEYEHAISKLRLFPVAFSLKGLGDSRGVQFDSLMRICEEQIAESLAEHAPELSAKVRVTSSELAIEWLEQQAKPHLKVALDAWLHEQHQLDAAQFRAKHGDKKLGQEIVASRLAEGQLKSKYKERFTHIWQQITKLGGYTGVAKSADALRPRVMALTRLNGINELGPAIAGTANIAADFQKHEGSLWICPAAAEADVAGATALCPKCDWTPEKSLPQPEHDRIAQAITQGLADRLQRLKDASISTILKKADGDKGRSDLKALLEIIQLANADKLADVMTDELADFLRQLLQDANIVQESIMLAPILQQIGAIEEDRVDEAVSKFTSLLKNAIKDAKAKHGTGKRVRVFLRMDDGGSPPPA
jgi:hypothetical protein